MNRTDICGTYMIDTQCDLFLYLTVLPSCICSISMKGSNVNEQERQSNFIVRHEIKVKEQHFNYCSVAYIMKSVILLCNQSTKRTESRANLSNSM